MQVIFTACDLTTARGSLYLTSFCWSSTSFSGMDFEILLEIIVVFEYGHIQGPQCRGLCASEKGRVINSVSRELCD